MIIKMVSIDEFKPLWRESLTKNYFIDGLERGNIEFWTVENEETKELIGELYIFWDSEDKDEANGKDRAYLCAFRIEKEFSGQGLGKKLMYRALERVKEKGFNEVTIGVDDGDAERLTSMYKAWGFTELVKLQHYDYHYINVNNEPSYYEEPYALYLKRLNKISRSD